MNRINTIIELDEAIATLERVITQVSNMGCSFSMISRIEIQIRQMIDLRIDILQADLPNEGEE